MVWQQLGDRSGLAGTRSQFLVALSSCLPIAESFFSLCQQFLPHLRHRATAAFVCCLLLRYYDQAATHSDKAWVPVQIALVHLHIRMWYDEYALNGDLMVYGYKIEDILLTVLVGLLTLLFYLRMQAVAAPPPQ